MAHPRLTLLLAGFNGALATGLAAVGAHALHASLPPADRDMFATATQFHLLHALALLALAACYAKVENPSHLMVSSWLFQAGIVAFSGSLYVRVIAGPGGLGPFHWITPLGGLVLILAWLSLLLLRPKP